MLKLLIWGSFILLPFANLYSQKILYLNEVMADNEDALQDREGDSPDWIELYNPTTQAISLLNWKIGDSDHLWTFPDITIEAQDFLIVFASDKDKLIDGVEPHTNFKLSSDGEKVRLVDPNNEVIDEVNFPELEDDFSYGRLTLEGESWTMYSLSSPRRPNEEGDIFYTHETELSCSLPSGFYQKDIDIVLEKDNPNSKIYYTLDGSEPQEDDFLYESPITFSLSQKPVPEISNISTSDEWVEPKGTINTSYVLRARAFRTGQADSKIIHASYFLHPEGAARYSLPVISLQTEVANFFDDDIGIYVKGNQDNFQQSGKNWERPVSVDFFDTMGDLVLKQRAGIRVSGAKTRLEPQKTVRLYARKQYENKTFDYPFFGEEYGRDISRINLRTLNVTRWSKAAIMDDLAHQIIDGEVNTDYVKRKFVIVFLNGEYWGIHSMREHNNEHFLARKYGIDDDDIRFYKGADAFTNTAPNYNNLINNLQNYNLSIATDYAKVAQQLDIEHYTDYMITNLVFANVDWPQNNMEFWDAPDFDGKLRFVINDLDAAMHYHQDDRLSIFFEQERNTFGLEHREWATFILQKLFENADYRLYFHQRLTELLNTTFAPERTIPIWQNLTTEIRPEMKEHTFRWHFPESVKQWEIANDKLERFLLLRPDHIMQQAVAHFGFPIKVFPNPIQDKLTIDILSWTSGIVDIQLYNTAGQMMFETKKHLEEGKQQIELFLPESIGKGAYFLKISLGGQLFTEKVFKM